MEALEYFRMFAKEFSNLPDEKVNGWITSASLFVNVSTLETEKQNLATALYAAHLCWVDKYKKGGERGTISKEKDGDLERQYNSIENANTFLGQNSYGMQYAELTGAFKTVRLPTIMTRFP